MSMFGPRQPLIDTFLDRNSQINLSALRTPEDVYTKHILDSLELNNILDNLTDLPLVKACPELVEGGGKTLQSRAKQGPGNLDEASETHLGSPKKIGTKNEGQGVGQEGSITLLDLGTGGGFPLLPLATTHPERQCVGLDSRKKKLTAIQAIADQLGLTNVSTVWSRAEDHKQQYDIVTSRAVAYIDTLLPRALPLVKKGGYLVLYKLFTHEEDDRIIDLTRQKNLEIVGLHHYTLPGDQTERILYLIKKATP